MSLTVPECLDSNSCQECFYHPCLPKSLQPFLSEVGLTGFSVPPSPPEEIRGVHGIWSNTLQSLETLATVESGCCLI